MDTKFNEHSNWGFSNPEPGWYAMEFTGDFTEKTNETNGKNTLRVPLKIVGGDYDGSLQSVFITLNPASEGEAKMNKAKVGNIIGACKLGEAFDKKFPGEISALDKQVIDAMKVRVTGKTVMVRLDSSKSKDGKEYLNIVEMAPVGYDGAKDGKPKAAGSSAPKPAAEEW
jgi:hypothetical protein